VYRKREKEGGKKREGGRGRQIDKEKNYSIIKYWLLLTMEAERYHNLPSEN
jgi:hypothetical protein